MLKLPEFMTETIEIECINCGWIGTKEYLDDTPKCPNCDTDEYVYESEKEYDN